MITVLYCAEDVVSDFPVMALSQGKLVVVFLHVHVYAHLH